MQFSGAYGGKIAWFSRSTAGKILPSTEQIFPLEKNLRLLKIAFPCYSCSPLIFPPKVLKESNAFLPSSESGALPCQEYCHSIKSTPLPGMV